MEEAGPEKEVEGKVKGLTMEEERKGHPLLIEFLNGWEVERIGKDELSSVGDVAVNSLLKGT